MPRGPELFTPLAVPSNRIEGLVDEITPFGIFMVGWQLFADDAFVWAVRECGRADTYIRCGLIDILPSLKEGDSSRRG